MGLRFCCCGFDGSEFGVKGMFRFRTGWACFLWDCMVWSLASFIRGGLQELQFHRTELKMNTQERSVTIGALINKTGCGGILYYDHVNKEPPQNPILVAKAPTKRRGKHSNGLGLLTWMS